MLRLEALHKAFDHVPVLHGVSLTVEQGEILCLLGPSGCGKTTLLRIIGGLEKADSGRVLFMGADISSIPPHQRGFGLMFQDFALFPHMNVSENIAFGLRMQGLNSEQIHARVAEMLELVGLAKFGSRSVTELSGGEQQRVALARSLAPQPQLLMLDEPLGSLDAALREQLVTEVRDIIKAAGVSAIYVTHDQSEAFSVADLIAVMNAGHIEQISTPEALYLHPQTVFVAQFLGLGEILTSQQAALFNASEAVLLHPAYLELDPQGKVELTVTRRIFRGDHHQLRLHHTAADFTLIMQIPSTASQIPQVGDSVKIRVREGGLLPLK